MLQSRFKTCFSLLCHVLFKCEKSTLSYKRTYTTTKAGILVIGDEILKGLRDVNTPYLIKELNLMNVSVIRVAILPDDIDAISAEVKELSSKCSFVITSGGIGPTHDDVTYEAVAKACNEDLVLNNDILQLVTRYFGPESRNNPGILKYCKVPGSAVVNFVDIDYNNKSIKYPIVSVQNIYTFPGVPVLLQKSFEALKTKFIINSIKTFSKYIYTDADEFSITATLNEAVEKFKGFVKFGSYPTFNNNYYKVKLVLESQSENNIEKAYNFLHKHLPKDCIVNYKTENIFITKQQVHSYCKVFPFMASAITVIEEAINKYSLSELCLCFNGGKDCTALLHLFYSCVGYLKQEEWKQVKFLYVRTGEPFNEVEAFIQSCAEFYNFDLTTIDGSLKESISVFLEKNPNVKAMLMGTRRCDPGAADLLYFCSTDSDWPSVIRVLPLLDWTYSDVWHYLRELQIPYCILYDRGFTSLGDKSKTVQNQSLLHDERLQSYKPAYMLKNPESERKSRL